jgi:Undecaprenyl-phosphate glucose phosphotransferase
MISTIKSWIEPQHGAAMSPADASRGETADAIAPLDFIDAGRRPLISRAVIRGLARIGECILLSLLGFAIAYTYVPLSDLQQSSQYQIALLTTALITVLTYDALNLYTVNALSNVSQILSRLMLGWLFATGLLMAGVFFMKIGPEFSRVWLGSWFVGGAVMTLVARMIFSIAVRHWVRQGQLQRRAVVYGWGDKTAGLISALQRDVNNDARVLGYFERGATTGVPKSVSNVPFCGDLDALIDVARRTRIDIAILDIPVADEQRLLTTLKRLSQLPLDIRLPAETTSVRFRPRTYSYIGVMQFIDVFDRPISDWGHFAKSIFDRTIATAALVLLSPLMAAVAIAIKLESKGPVLFRQKRYGFNNELIEVFKFRSMYTDLSDATAAKLVTKDDPRVTRIGRFIRKTSIDELPQLFNVLNGTLSLVGPRPHATHAKAANELYNEVVDGYFARHKVKPGITGWAQINGWRGETDTREKIEKRVEYDLYYIDNWSLFLDFYILLRTPFALLDTRNAY